MIVSNIVGSFGKCLKISPNKDKLYVVRENFAVNILDLTLPQVAVKDSFEVKENIDLFSDWCVDHKTLQFYFLMNNGAIVMVDHKVRTRYAFRVEEKWFITLSKEDRNFTAMNISPSGKLLAISGVVTYKDKKTNNIFLYKVESDKGEPKLNLHAQVATENTWEGNKDYITFIDLSTTLNKCPVLVCATQCTSLLYFYCLSGDKLLPLLPPRPAHTHVLNQLAYSETTPGCIWTCSCDKNVTSHYLL